PGCLGRRRKIGGTCFSGQGGRRDGRVGEGRGRCSAALEKNFTRALAKNFTSVNFPLKSSHCSAGILPGSRLRPGSRWAGESRLHDGHRAEAGRFVGFGVSWLLTMLLFAWGGLALDRRIGSTPVLLILGILVGFAGGFCALYLRAVAKPANQRSGEGKSPGRSREES
ncbi:MAG: AtpZ/AtpI family protein, partial [Gemmatimonadetes bacterium]|nr:AtpZ/AtpI family protein [Gemmatimonadota bacterium]